MWKRECGALAVAVNGFNGGVGGKLVIEDAGRLTGARDVDDGSTEVRSKMSFTRAAEANDSL